jgi:acetylornithine deacetylase/succinyl-diaminopimelate desuccinylase-like protein
MGRTPDHRGLKCEAMAGAAGAIEGWEPARLHLVEHAWSGVDRSALADTLIAMVDIPSPAGEEQTLATWLVDRMTVVGLEAEYQPLSATSGNAMGWLRGSGDGPTLLLYAPVDAAWRGEDADLPVLGGAREDLLPGAKRRGDLVVGLAAENPKAYAACVLAAAQAIRWAEIPLRGTLAVGFGAGGMPIGPPPGGQGQVGHGLGATQLVEAVGPDQAVIAKPGDAVAYEEVGLCWFRIGVRGTLGYTGVRHLLAYRNPIVEMARLLQGLEAWFPTYTAANTSGCVAPQGAIGAVRGGWSQAPAFTPATCEFWVDLRVSPRTPIQEVERQFAETLRRLASETGAEVEWERVLAIPGTSTPPGDPIIRSSIRAWELVAGRPHRFRTGTSGATDANLIRAAGVPTARVGMPAVEPPEDLRGFSMGVADPTAMAALTRTLCAVAIDTCGPSGRSAA